MGGGKIDREEAGKRYKKARLKTRGREGNRKNRTVNRSHCPGLPGVYHCHTLRRLESWAGPPFVSGISKCGRKQ